MECVYNPVAGRQCRSFIWCVVCVWCVCGVCVVCVCVCVCVVCVRLSVTSGAVRPQLRQFSYGLCVRGFVTVHRRLMSVFRLHAQQTRWRSCLAPTVSWLYNCSYSVRVVRPTSWTKREESRTSAWKGMFAR